MLVLSRKPKQQIVIDGRIVLTVVQIRGGTVRLGIKAPASVPVHRQEVHEAIGAEELAQSRERGSSVHAGCVQDRMRPGGD